MKVEIARRINNSRFKAFFAIAGGGQSFIGEFTKISGASNTLIGALVPYSKHVFDSFTGAQLEHYVSEEAARKLALASFKECLNAGVPIHNALGFGVTSSIAKDGERWGREHKMFLAVHSFNKTVAQAYVLQQGRTRIEEEAFFCDVIECALANATNEELTIDNVCVPRGIELRENETRRSRTARRPVMFLSLNYNVDGPLVIFPGSFNPFHDGHEAIYNLATEITGCTPFLELCMTNTDKGTIDYFDVEDRVKTMRGHPYMVTTTPTFREKIEILSMKYPINPLIFVVGADTWQRIWDPKYAGPVEPLEREWYQKGVHFLVFPRGNLPIAQPNGIGERLRIKDRRASTLAIALSSREIRASQNL